VGVFDAEVIEYPRDDVSMTCSGFPVAGSAGNASDYACSGGGARQQRLEQTLVQTAERAIAHQHQVIAGS
jgi:hypothetical protein